MHKQKVSVIFHNLTEIISIPRQSVTGAVEAIL
jgi:hypothetical protein